MSAIAELTSQEKAKPYAKYYYREPATPDPEMLAAVEEPMDASKVLPIEQINALLNSGYHEVESGWCIQPNGSAYVANHTKMPGVTVDMINWWMAWHSLEDLRYKIWWPPGHFSISISKEDRQKVLDPDRPLVEKFQGLTHHVTENIGGLFAEKIVIQFLKPEDCGFDLCRFKSPNVGTLVAANAVSQLMDSPPGMPDVKMQAFMCHFIREISGGIEYRTRFWLGYQIQNKKPEFLLPQDLIIPDFIPKGLAVHNICEYAKLASFLPEIYEEQKGVVQE